MVSDNKFYQTYVNQPQVDFMRINPTYARLLWGRGTGKTEVPISYRIFNCARKMPGSTTAFATPSYKKFFIDLIPGIRLGLSRFKMHEDVHYIIGKKPPKKLNWDEPIYKPNTYENVISFANGSIIKLVSQDSKVSQQGNCYDAVIGDEAKLLDKQRIDEEILKALRGNAHRFKNVAEYGSQLYTTDKFVKSKHHTWVFKPMEDFDPDIIVKLKQLLNYVDYLKINKKDPTPVLKEIEHFAKVFPYVSHASSVENAYALGIDFFKRVADSSTPIELLVSLFNEDYNNIEDGYYYLLDEYIHGYSSSNVDYLMGYGFNKHKQNCQMDNDINYSIPLRLALDFGGVRNFGTVMQYNRKVNTINLLKDILETKYEGVIDTFDNYYQPFKMKNKQVELWCDASGTKQVPNSNLTFAEDAARLLRAKGWNVTIKTINSAYISHSVKFKIWEKILDESPSRDVRFPTFRFNKDNAFRAYISMAKAGQVEYNGQIKKDKKDEKNMSKDQQYTTHFSDCVDYGICPDFVDLILDAPLAIGTL
jgi:hypothetical protein